MERDATAAACGIYMESILGNYGTEDDEDDSHSLDQDYLYSTVYQEHDTHRQGFNGTAAAPASAGDDRRELPPHYPIRQSSAMNLSTAASVAAVTNTPNGKTNPSTTMNATMTTTLNTKPYWDMCLTSKVSSLSVRETISPSSSSSSSTSSMSGGVIVATPPRFGTPPVPPPRRW